MVKTSANKPAARGARSAVARPHKGRAARTSATRMDAGKARVEAVMLAAEQSGLLSKKRGRIGGRVSPVLIRQAKRQTGIEADTELIVFALATVALEDNFAKTFEEARRKVDPRIKLDF